MFTQHFFIEGKFYGSVPRQGIFIDRGSYGAPLSKLFFCAECGEVFARCPVARASGETTSWQAVFACCRLCNARSGLHIPGSIWHHEQDFTGAFPEAVLQWEFQRHLGIFDKEQGNDRE